MNCLLSELQRKRLEVVLVAPPNPLNIGAAARAMANFGFSRLAVVAPYGEHWREARSAIGAPELLKNAKETGSLAEALADCTLVVGTGSLERRKAEQPVVKLPELAPRVARELERGGRVAVVFGSEKHGLKREDLAYCHLLVEIPTDSWQPSMNLGQAVAVCLYEIAARTNAAEEDRGEAVPHRSRKNKDAARVGHPRPTETDGPATARELERLAGVVEETMRAANYSPAAMQRANRHDLRLLLRRLALTGRDARRILGLFRRILWRVQHDAKGARDEPLDITRK
jgi:tRNA/rRNA methyltransferase